MTAVAVGVGWSDGFLVELGEEDVGDGVMDGFGRGFKQVGETDVEAAFAKTDGGVERGEAAEADVEWGDGRARTEFAVLLLEDGDEGCGRGGFSGSGLSGAWNSRGLEFGRRLLGFGWEDREERWGC